MDNEKVRTLPDDHHEEIAGSTPGKRPWQEPKLKFVEPKLTKVGDLQKVTGFFTTIFP
jgi:hypothetical protein